MVTSTEEVRAYALSAYLDFDNWYAEEIRKAKEEAWDEAKNQVRSIPHWYDPVNQTGGFDLSSRGPENSSEDGAFDSVMNALSRNPYRKD